MYYFVAHQSDEMQEDFRLSGQTYLDHLEQNFLNQGRSQNDKLTNALDHCLDILIKGSEVT